MKIGIPRALLYYRCADLWKTFFSELGLATVTSPPTNKKMLDAGNHYSIDENCLSSKLFFGHVAALEGKCDRVFVPRIANYGKDGVLCSRFEALYDMCTNTFRDTGIRFLTCNIDLQQKCTEEDAYAGLGPALGRSSEAARKAYRKALAISESRHKAEVLRQEQVIRNSDKMKVLVVGHPYNLYDAYIGQPILKQIENLGALAVCADKVDLARARKDSLHICRDVPWIMSRELLGAVDLYHSQADGIILLTAFPCGPDSMVNEMIIHRVKDKPILNLILDSQDASAGVETRLESFIDIIRFRKGLL